MSPDLSRVPFEEMNAKKTETSYDAYDVELPQEKGDVKRVNVKRSLKERHVSMIAIGGTIGTGLFIGLSGPLTYAGPVNSLIAYLFVGSLGYFVTQSLGEMATFTPIAGSFCVFNARYLSKSLGFATGWLYWWSWSVTFAIELSIVGQVIQYWDDTVPIWGWIVIFYVILVGLNFVPVQFYGEVEFWMAAGKVLAILGFIIYALCMVCGAGSTGPVGFRYWLNPGPWGPGLFVDNINTARFLGWLSSLINAAFTFLGVELTGVTAGETNNPRKSVPKAINKVVFRIFVFYILSLFFVGLLVPYNDPKLSSADSFISSSPFVVAIQNSGTKVLPDIFNAVIIITIISAGNSDIYIGSRTLYSMANSGVAPAFFARTTSWGVPYYGVICSSLVGLLAFLNLSNSGITVFNWLVSISAVSSLIAWQFIAVSHIRFMQTLKDRGMSRNDLPFKAVGMPYGAWYCAIAVCIILFIQGYNVFFDFNAADFFASYISLILFFVLWIAAQIYHRERPLKRLCDVDIDTDRLDIDEIVYDDVAPKNLWEKIWDFIL